MDGFAWAATTGGYYEACGGADGNLGAFGPGRSLADASAACCADEDCAGFSYSNATGSGVYKKDAK